MQGTYVDISSYSQEMNHPALEAAEPVCGPAKPCPLDGNDWGVSWRLTVDLARNFYPLELVNFLSIFPGGMEAVLNYFTLLILRSAFRGLMYAGECLPFFVNILPDKYVETRKDEAACPL